MASCAGSLLILVALVIQVKPSEQQTSNGLIDTLNNGMKIAQDFLASESVALKVAEFVVRAFQPGNKGNNPSRPSSHNEAYSNEGSYTNKAPNHSNTDNERPNHFNTIEKPNHFNSNERPSYLNSNEYINKDGYIDNNVYESQSPMTPLRHIVKLFGLQPNQISAVAINALVLVAQMISTFLAGPRRPSRSYKSEDPTSWILAKNSSKLQYLLNTAKNESLIDLIEETIDYHSTSDASCIRLLVCKITPFVYKMQSAVFGGNSEEYKESERSNNLKGSASLYRHLPSADELNKQSDVCENKYKDCDLNE